MAAAVSTDELSSQTNDVPYFTLKGHVTEAKVVRVYDGDTIHVVFRYFDQYYKWNCRIAHVDTPELRTKNTEEKQRGYLARDKLSELIMGKVVKMECFEFDKYGRLLVEIQVPGSEQKVHEWLIENGHAKAYEGGTKEKW